MFCLSRLKLSLVIISKHKLDKTNLKTLIFCLQIMLDKIVRVYNIYIPFTFPHTSEGGGVATIAA